MVTDDLPRMRPPGAASTGQHPPQWTREVLLRAANELLVRRFGS